MDDNVTMDSIMEDVAEGLNLGDSETNQAENIDFGEKKETKKRG